MKICSKLKPVTMHWIIYGYDSKGILVLNLKYEHAISFINLVKFIYQMPRSISSKLFVIASGEANVYGSSYYWNFRTSSFKQVACLISSATTPRPLLLRLVWCISKTTGAWRFINKIDVRYKKGPVPCQAPVVKRFLLQ